MFRKLCRGLFVIGTREGAVRTDNVSNNVPTGIVVVYSVNAMYCNDAVLISITK